jgi:hypothetical protein
MLQVAVSVRCFSRRSGTRLPSGLVEALEDMVLGLRLVAPKAFVVSGAFHRVLSLSGWQPAVGEAGGESLESPDLFGVINHFGRSGFGQYTAHSRQHGLSLMIRKLVRDASGTVKPSGRVHFLPPLMFCYRRRVFHWNNNDDEAARSNIFEKIILSNQTQQRFPFHR